MIQLACLLEASSQGGQVCGFNTAAQSVQPHLLLEVLALMGQPGSYLGDGITLAFDVMVPAAPAADLLHLLLQDLHTAYAGVAAVVALAPS